MDIRNYIIQNFERNIAQEGSFWRLAQLDTFRDLLMLQAGKVSKKNVDEALLVEIILIALKALVNDRLGVKEYTADYKKLNKELFSEQENVHAEVEWILSRSLMNVTVATESFTPTEDLDCFEVLHNLALNNHSIAFFEKVLVTFLGYMKLKTNS